MRNGNEHRVVNHPRVRTVSFTDVGEIEKPVTTAFYYVCIQIIPSSPISKSKESINNYLLT
jgi:hypothetical protein